MGKWDDDIPLRPRGSVQPSSVAALLRSLKLTDAPKNEQAAGIKAWLRNHAPGPAMQYSLRRKGYGQLLDSRVSA
ncbi:hypothetical protein [Mycolicibacter arupensis]|jgi:hypothetical protein|uniref:Uncharacterized protein n=1 Tax=Mycolicibacter arupensis TaxID=342002 RepID=A0A5C7XY20_9MYCO|nr:hypothetical protein [Mycolicibacter arupensis]MCV7277084.1 hypothetical protein [Mycolicibacter arupensis]OQZ93686.1 hypothetical protein BST15_17605 [Mycolicibacter arupensis]TXI54447.1 MAG: hypothetical protein E6Q54_14700 [Mycolicibacter arupensis]